MAVSRYLTLRAIKHSGSDFAASTPIALSDEYAAPLLAIGAIQGQAGALPVMPTAPGDIVRETLDTGSGGRARTYVEVISSDSGVEESLGGVAFRRAVVASSIADARSDLSGTAGAHRFDGVAGSVVSEVPRIAGTVWYVSNAATNGFTVGLDVNSGLSKALPKLTLASAFTAASAGDVIILNDGTFDSAFFEINKSVTILPYSYRGTTIRSTNTSYTIYVNAHNVTIGALVVDSTITTGGFSGAAVRTPAAAAYRAGLRLIGTKLLANTYSVYNTAPCVLKGVEVVSIGSAKSRIDINAAAAGTVRIEDLNNDGYMVVKASVSGVDCIVRRANVRSAAAGNQRAFEGAGCRSYLIEDSEFGVDTSTGPTGILITPHATIATESVVIRRNRIRNGVAAEQTTTGYGIAVGAEAAATLAPIVDVKIYGNDVSHANHGLFMGYGVTKGRAWGNVVRDVVIGLISKLAGSDVVHHSNIVVGGPLSGGALRTKGVSGSKHYNNLVIMDASSVAAGLFALCDDATEGPSVGAIFANNILYAPLRTVKAILVGVTSSAAFSCNNYFAGAWGAGAFNGDDTFAAWRAIEPTALAVDPAYTIPGDFRLPSGSALNSAAATVLAECDFMGDIVTERFIGPLPAA